MLRTCRCSTCPASSPTRLRVHRAVAAAGLHAVLPAPAGRPGRRRGVPAALDAAGVEVASVLPLYRWSGPDEDERQAAVRYWKRAIEITVELGCRRDELGVQRPTRGGGRSEAQFWRSLEELLPIFEREGVRLRLEPHPDDFVEDGVAAVDMVRGIDSRLVSFLYCAPHTFHLGGDIAGIMGYAGPAADPPARRRLLRPPGLVRPALHRQPAGLDGARPPAPGHRAGRGRLGRSSSRTSAEVGFDGIMTVCVFAWEERARDSATVQPGGDRISYRAKHGVAGARDPGRSDTPHLTNRRRARRRPGPPR